MNPSHGRERLRPPVWRISACRRENGKRILERRSGIRCRVDARLSQVDVDPSRAAAIYMIIQEALTNVLQHAHATRATVRVRRSRQTLKVAVADNGRGISDRDLASAGSLGLIGMRERTVLLRGTFEARRRQPRGTIVTFTVPLISDASICRRAPGAASSAVSMLGRIRSNTIFVLARAPPPEVVTPSMAAVGTPFTL